MPGLAEVHDPGRVSLLHSVSHYTSWMGQTASKWDNRTLVNQGDISYGTAPLGVRYPTYLHLALAVYMLSAAAIDTSLSGKPNVTLLGPHDAGDTGVGIICCCKTVYVPPPTVSLLLSADISPVES